LRDLTKIGTTIAARAEALIGKMDNMSTEELRAEFIAVLESEGLTASTATVAKWKRMAVAGREDLMHAIANLYLAAAGMRVG